MRIAPLKREAAAYIIIRRQGVSINQIAKFFGRSTSFVHRILKRAFSLSVDSFSLSKDLRKLPARVKLLAALRTEKFMVKMLPAWEAFILGEGEKPP